MDPVVDRVFSGKILAGLSVTGVVSPTFFFPGGCCGYPWSISFGVLGETLGPVSALGNSDVDVTSLLEGAAWHLTLRC
jgi:hypothetical protein